MYLAHHATFLGHQYRARLPQALRSTTVTTLDQAHELRKMAASIFLKAMQGHRAALIDTLRESVCECSTSNAFISSCNLLLKVDLNMFCSPVPS